MSAERVTPEELAEVHALYARANTPGIASESYELCKVKLAVAASKLAREVERLTAEKAEILAIAERACGQRDAAEMALGALREKARGVCHARRFPATLQHAINDLAAEVDKP